VKTKMGGEFKLMGIGIMCESGWLLFKGHGLPFLLMFMGGIIFFNMGNINLAAKEEVKTEAKIEYIPPPKKIGFCPICGIPGEGVCSNCA